MAFISDQRTITWENFRKIRFKHLYQFCLVLMLIVPFITFKRSQPLVSFFVENLAVILGFFTLFFVTLHVKTVKLFNPISLFCFLIAGYLVFDMLVNSSVYPQLNLLYIGTIFCAGLLAVGLRYDVLSGNGENVFTIVCFTLMVGALFQSIAGLIQLIYPSGVQGFIAPSNAVGVITGNLGQRNLYAHYLFWGLLCTCYLLVERKVNRFFLYPILLIQIITLGIANSRTIALFIIATLVIVAFAFIKSSLKKKQLITTAGVVMSVFVSQMMMSTIMNKMLHANTASSIERIASGDNILIRVYEWYKAILIFLDKPLTGHGWTSYAYQAFWKDGQGVLADAPKINDGIFGHSHSLLPQLLAELGILGTGLIVGSFIWLIARPIILKSWSSTQLFAILLVTTTLVHSQVEFPLWYAHFFFVFIIALCFCLPSDRSDDLAWKKQGKAMVFEGLKYKPISLIIIIISLSGIYQTSRLWVGYQDIFNTKLGLLHKDTAADRVKNSRKVLYISKINPLLKPYAEMSAVNNFIGFESNDLPEYIFPSITRFSSYIPYPNVSSYQLYVLCKKDNAVEAKALLNQLITYYPENLNQFSVAMSMTECSELADQVYLLCHKKRKSKLPDIKRGFCNINEVRVAKNQDMQIDSKF